jgi:hypothetical protein
MMVEFKTTADKHCACCEKGSASIVLVRHQHKQYLQANGILRRRAGVE